MNKRKEKKKREKLDRAWRRENTDALMKKNKDKEKEK